MLNRDFTKTKKEYLKKNRLALAIIACFLIVGAVFLAIWGLNTNPEFSGCNRVEITVGKEVSSKDLDDYSAKINKSLNENNCSLYSLTLKGEGENSILEIRYVGKSNENTINAINTSLIQNLEIGQTSISSHEKVSKTVSSTDYTYTILACLLIIVFSVIFVWARYNLAYGICLLSAGLFAPIALILTLAILRIEVSSAIFFMIVGSVVFTTFESLILFENMREIQRDKNYKNDLASHLRLGLKNMAGELQFAGIALFTIGFLFVIFGTQSSRLIALTFMFTVIASLLTFVFILPFAYNLVADKAKFKTTNELKKDSKVKVVEATVVNDDASNENTVANENNEKADENAEDDYSDDKQSDVEDRNQSENTENDEAVESPQNEE